MRFGRFEVDLTYPRVMGVLNVTPDSFSDGGRFSALDDALFHAERMIAEGAAIIDVGGESTRPNASPVSEQQELDRVAPVVAALIQRFSVPISVDTSASRVMAEVIALGASLINDVRALRRQDALAVLAASDIPVCLMHMRGEPSTMQVNPSYTDVVDEVAQFFVERLAALHSVGIERDRVLLDPGIGFGKTVDHNLALLRELQVFADMGSPVLLGVSRKSLLGAITGRPVHGRLAAGLGVALYAAQRGARIIRAHDVAETVDVLKVFDAFEGVVHG